MHLSDRESHDGCSFTCSEFPHGNHYRSWNHCKNKMAQKILLETPTRSTRVNIFHPLLFMQGIMMMTSGFFRLLSDLPKPVWRYPISYISYGAWAIQVPNFILKACQMSGVLCLILSRHRHKVTFNYFYF